MTDGRDDAAGPDDAETPDDEFPPEDFADTDPDPRPKTTLRRVGRPGQMIGAAMIGLAEVLETRPKAEIPIEIATPGEPPNIDTDGLDEPFGVGSERMVAPPMDRLKAKTRAGRTVKRRR